MKIVHFTQVLIGLGFEVYGLFNGLDWQLIALGNLTVYIGIIQYKNDKITMPDDGK